MQCPNDTVVSELTSTEDGWLIAVETSGGGDGGSADDALRNSGTSLSLADNDKLVIQENCPTAPSMQLMVFVLYVKGATNITVTLKNAAGGVIDSLAVSFCYDSNSL